MKRNIRRETLRNMVADYQAGEFGKTSNMFHNADTNIVHVKAPSTTNLYAGEYIGISGLLYPDMTAEGAYTYYKTNGIELAGKVIDSANDIKACLIGGLQENTIGKALLHGVFGSYVYDLKVEGEDEYFHRFITWDQNKNTSVSDSSIGSFIDEYKQPYSHNGKMIGAYGGPWQIIARSQPSVSSGTKRWFCIAIPSWTGHRIGQLDAAYTKTITDGSETLAKVNVGGGYLYFCNSPLQAAGDTIPTSTQVCISVNTFDNQTQIISAECF